METLASIKEALLDLQNTAAAEKAEHDAEKADWEAKNKAAEDKAADAVSKVGALEAEIALLKQNGQASQAELDALGVSVAETKAAVQGIVVTAIPAVTPIP